LQNQPFTSVETVRGYTIRTGMDIPLRGNPRHPDCPRLNVQGIVKVEVAPLPLRSLLGRISHLTFQAEGQIPPQTLHFIFMTCHKALDTELYIA
jgi:hypothetical protein